MFGRVKVKAMKAKRVTFLITDEELENTDLPKGEREGINRALDIADNVVAECIENGAPTLQTSSYKQNWIEGIRHVKELIPNRRLDSVVDTDDAPIELAIGRQQGFVDAVNGISNIVKNNPITNYTAAKQAAMNDGANYVMTQINAAFQKQMKEYSRHISELTKLPEGVFEDTPGTTMDSVMRAAVRHPVAATATVLSLVVATAAAVFFGSKGSSNSR